MSLSECGEQSHGLTDCWRAVINRVKHFASVISISASLIGEHLFFPASVLFVRFDLLEENLGKAITSIRARWSKLSSVYTHTHSTAADISFSFVSLKGRQKVNGRDFLNENVLI